MVTGPSADPIVRRLIDLHMRIEQSAQECSTIRGWRPLRLDNNGSVVAERIEGGEHTVQEFKPVGEWKKAAQYLEMQNEFRTLLFSKLTPGQLHDYRIAIGLSAAGSDAAPKNGKKKEREGG
jgi:hypothetical protein